MSYRVFVAGATGAIGRRIVPLLRQSGHIVTGMTRSREKAEMLRSIGVQPVLVDVFDADLVFSAVKDARPEIVIHQLTDLPKGLEPSLMDHAVLRNARIRSEGTRNLVRAAQAAGARRLIAQSIGWAYAPGNEPHEESDPLDIDDSGDRGITVRGVIALEDWTLRSSPLQGVVLRYGQLHGPGTHADKQSVSAPVHVDAAASAAVLAIEHGAPGVHNIAQPNAYMNIEKARTQLGWDPDFRLPSNDM
jgi:nucleoside-diphosphate-sugar epimerase